MRTDATLQGIRILDNVRWVDVGGYGWRGSPIPRSIVVVFVGAVYTALASKQGHTAGAMVKHRRVVCTEDQQIIAQLIETTVLVPAG